MPLGHKSFNPVNPLGHKSSRPINSIGHKRSSKIVYNNLPERQQEDKKQYSDLEKTIRDN